MYFNKKEGLPFGNSRDVLMPSSKHEKDTLCYMNLMTLDLYATSGAECSMSMSRKTTISDPSANLGFTT